MSVLVELTMFPTDKGESVSSYVSRIIDMIDRRGLDYRLTPMGTIMEFDDLTAAMKVVTDSYGLLEPDCNRVYGTIRLDIRKGKEQRLVRKIESVERQLGRKPKTG